MENLAMIDRRNIKPLDRENSRPLRFSYFCDYNELPGVVACGMKVNPPLRDSCYNDLTEILDKLD